MACYHRDAACPRGRSCPGWVRDSSGGDPGCVLGPEASYWSGSVGIAVSTSAQFSGVEINTSVPPGTGRQLSCLNSQLRVLSKCIGNFLCLVSWLVFIVHSRGSQLRDFSGNSQTRSLSGLVCGGPVLTID